MNSLFQWNGVWHLMQQWHARPHTSVGHAVSGDLLHFERIADVLSSGASGDEQCYDGSSSITSKGPMLMIDGGCTKKGPGNIGCMESSGNDTGGVTAFPDDLSDRNLTQWTLHGPTVFTGCDGSAGPSPSWRNAVTGKQQLIAIHGRGEALFEATSEDLTAWKMVDPAFLPARGGGGGLFHLLPPNVAGVPGPRPFTHMMQVNSDMGDGRPTFALLTVDAASSKAFNLTASVPLDIGQGVAYGQLSNSGGTAAHGSPGDSRTVHVSWLSTANGGPCRAPDVDVGQLTCFRDIRYDPRSQRLVETPIEEYHSLRSCGSGSGTPACGATVHSLGPTPASVLALGPGPSAVDIELNFTLAAAGNRTVQVGVACNPSMQPRLTCGMMITLEVLSGAGTGISTVTMSIDHADAIVKQPSRQERTFSLFPDEAVLPLRIMTDTRSVEVFAGHGRGVFSGGLSFAFCEDIACAVVATANTPTSGSAHREHAVPLEVQVASWSMAL